MSNVIALLKSDLLVKPGVANANLPSFAKVYFSSPLFRYTVWLRVFHTIKRRRLILYSPLGVLSYLIFKRLEYKYGVHISSNISIGPGLHIVHGEGVYVNVKSIGSDFTIYQNVTFGSIEGDKKPTIKNGVTVNPGAVIYGDVVLNDNCIIGANSVVNKDVAAGDIVAGAPAVSIRRK